MENFESMGWGEAFEQYGEDYVKTEFPKLLDKYFNESIKNKINLALNSSFVCIDGGELFLELVKAKNVDVIINNKLDAKKYDALFFIFKMKEISIDAFKELEHSLQGIRTYFSCIGDDDQTIIIGVKYENH